MITLSRKHSSGPAQLGDRLPKKARRAHVKEERSHGSGQQFGEQRSNHSVVSAESAPIDLISISSGSDSPRSGRFPDSSPCEAPGQLSDSPRGGRLPDSSPCEGPGQLSDSPRNCRLPDSSPYEGHGQLSDSPRSGRLPDSSPSQGHGQLCTVESRPVSACIPSIPSEPIPKDEVLPEPVIPTQKDGVLPKPDSGIPLEEVEKVVYILNQFRGKLNQVEMRAYLATLTTLSESQITNLTLDSMFKDI